MESRSRSRRSAAPTPAAPAALVARSGRTQAEDALEVVGDQGHREVEFVPRSSSVSRPTESHLPHPRKGMLHDRSDLRDRGVHLYVVLWKLLLPALPPTHDAVEHPTARELLLPLAAAVRGPPRSDVAASTNAGSAFLRSMPLHLRSGVLPYIRAIRGVVARFFGDPKRPITTASKSAVNREPGSAHGT